MRRLWEVRELSTVAILALEIAFFTWYLWPEGGRSHPFFNLGNFVLILKYSSLYGIAAIGAAMVIISAAEYSMRASLQRTSAGRWATTCSSIQDWNVSRSRAMPSHAV